MQVAHIFFDVHMGLAFNGLGDILKKNRINPSGSHVVFLNKKRNKFKLLINDKYLVYHDNKNNPVSMDSIRHLPQAFVGEKFDFSKSVEAAIREKFTSEGRKK
jgi:hypothetical protein